MVFTSAARSVTSRGPVRATRRSKLPSATRRASAASRCSGRIAVARRPTASSTTVAARPTATAMNTASSTVDESFRAATAWARAPEISPWSLAILARRASKSALPVRMSGLTTGLPVWLIWLMVGCA